MPSDAIVVSARNLTKAYRLFGHPGDRVKQFLSLGLRRYHREFIALQDVSFDVRRGEALGIIGRNGSGKSTLLQLVCGILKPTSGTVHVNGRISALLELGAGFNPEFTGRENVYFQGALMGLTQAQMNERYEEIAAFADIGEFIDQPVRTYSSGMFVRLAFSVAISVSPDILIIDEALAVGDLAFQSRCMEKLQELRNAGMTIVLVTHSHAVIAGLCSRAIYLSGGTLVNEGPPTQVLGAYEEELVQTERKLIDAGGANSSGIRILNIRVLDAHEQPRSHFRMHDQFVVEVSLESGTSLTSPCIGMEIRSANGFVLWNATSAGLGLKLPPLDPGSVKRIRWKFTAGMAPGTYSVSVGAGELAGCHYRRHDRLHHAAEITVLDAFGIQGYLPLQPVIEVAGESS